MKTTKIGARLFMSIIALFIIFAAAFVIFQQSREKKYKVELLNKKLQDYNERMEETLGYERIKDKTVLSNYVKEHQLPNLRVTLVNMQGKVVFDSQIKDYEKLPSHSNRQEIIEAIQKRSGYDINRTSSTTNKDYFYSATYFKNDSIVIRSALPYDNELTESLKTDRHYLWFALAIFIILTIILNRFVSRLSDNITKLRLFATKADNNESLETEELSQFPDDELGEIAEKIITLYKKLGKTKEEQTILKRQLTQNIAHELKTPVASIQGYLETLHENPDIDPEKKNLFIERSYAQTKRLTALLNDISTLNRMDDAPQEKKFEQYDIRQIIDNVIKETAMPLKEKKMTISHQLPATMPSIGNPSLAYSIFRNLTDNAIAYAGEGKHIDISAKEENGMWHFTFQDNGPGVEPSHLPRLFERFYRIDKGRSRKMGGTGLGLAIVKNAVMLHGGNITVKNVNDESNNTGLVFYFTLPRTK